MNDQLTQDQVSAMLKMNPVDHQQASGMLSFSNNILQGAVKGWDTYRNVAGSLSLGATKGVLSTLQNIGAPIAQTEANLINQNAGKVGIPQNELIPQGNAETVGYGGEKVGEFFLPGGGEKKALEVGATHINKLPELLGISGKGATVLTEGLKTALQSLIGAGSMAGVTAAQTGGDTNQEKSAAELGALSGPLSALKYAKGFLPDILSFTSSVPKGAIQTALKNPDTLKIGKDMTMAEIRGRAVKAIGAIDKNLKQTFSKSLEEFQKKAPANIGAFNNAQGFFKNTLQDTKEGLPSIFRDYGVSVQGNGTVLDFEKLNSPIVKGSEQRNLQQALDTINRQTNFSPMGVQRVASRLEALTKYGENNETSAIVTRIKNSYAKAIENVYPDLGKLRKNYGSTSKTVTEIKTIIGKSSDNPKQIQQSVNRLTQLFNDDKETYLNTIRTLGQITGTDFETLAASDKFKQILPSYIRGIGGGGAVSLGSAAVAHFLNPFYLLLLPLFSPAAIGKGIEYGEKLPQIGRFGLKAGQAGVQTMNEINQPESSQTDQTQIGQ